MNEAEAIELIANHLSNAIGGFTVYLSVTFAYLYVAYVAGADLSRLQFVIGSFLYVFAAFTTVMVVSINVQVMYSLVEHVASYSKHFENVPLWGGGFWELYMTGLQVGGILVGLFFMWDVRHPKTE